MDTLKISPAADVTPLFPVSPSLLQQTAALYHNAINTLDRKTGALASEYADQIACKKGCSGCCINGFKIRYIEGLNLLKGFSEAEPSIAATIMENLTNPGQLACPILVNGACGLYEHRPSLCRAYGIILKLRETVATCSLNFHDTKKPETWGERPLKTLDMQPYYDVMDDLSQTVWEVSPLPGLGASDQNANDAPRFDIRRLFEAFIRLQEDVG